MRRAFSHHVMRRIRGISIGLMPYSYNRRTVRTSHVVSTTLQKRRFLPWYRSRVEATKLIDDLACLEELAGSVDWDLDLSTTRIFSLCDTNTNGTEIIFGLLLVVFVIGTIRFSYS